MDIVSSVLDGPRAHHAFLLRTIVDAPWAIRIADRAPLSVIAAVEGRTWIVPDAGDPVAIDPGELALVRGPDAYQIGDEPDRVPTIVIHPGQRCETLDGEPLDDLRLGVRSWGAGGSHVVLSGTYETVGEAGRRLLDALPGVLAVAAADTDAGLIGLLHDEVLRDELGQSVVLDRLLDLVVVTTVRRWLATDGGRQPAWLRAHADPIVGAALRALQQRPAEQWTVAALAREVGLSRAALARRFTELVGEPPIGFLTRWRLALAADRLRGTDDGLAAIAADVGYGSPFALSAAFKREYGASPRDYRVPAPR